MSIDTWVWKENNLKPTATRHNIDINIRLKIQKTDTQISVT